MGSASSAMPLLVLPHSLPTPPILFPTPRVVRCRISVRLVPISRPPCRVLQGITAKLEALQSLPQDTPFRFYNANVATIRFSNLKGGR